MPQPLEESERDLAAEDLGSDEDAEGDEEEMMVDAIEQQEPESSDKNDVAAAPEPTRSQTEVTVEVTKRESAGSAKSESGEAESAESSETEAEAEVEAEAEAEGSEASEVEASEGSEFREDAEGEESDEEAVAQPKEREISAKSEEEGSGSSESEPASDALSEEDGDENASSSSSEEEESEKETDSDGSVAAASSDEDSEEEISKDKSDPNSCVYCKYGEHDGPKSDTGVQPYLTCSVCGDRAHQLCARAHEAVKDPDTWRCPSCVKNNLGAESGKLEDTKVSRPRGNSSRILKDLLPVARGVQKPGQHSVFAQLLLAEDDGNGPNLRKRKSPTGEPPPTMEKRRRKATPKAATTSKSPPEVKAQGKRDSGDELADQVVVAQPSSTSTRPSRRVTQRQSELLRAVQEASRPTRDRSRNKLIVRLPIDTKRVKEILRRPPQPKPSRRRADRKLVAPPPGAQSHSQRFPCLPTRSLIFPSIPQDHRDLTLSSSTRPYSGILDSKDASTRNTTSVCEIRDMFEGARQVAEEERRKASQTLDKETTSTPAPQQSRSNKRNTNPASKIERVQFGKYVIDSFYAAPYPEEFSHETRLFICEYCLKYLPSQYVAQRHKLKCPARHPPGDQIYVDGSVSVWEVDGRKKTEYCQCLCLMAKMFLGSKTLYYDVEPFLFYILTEADEDGYHFVGYFSKEKRPTSLNNVSCILVLPIHQRKGYATFLIDFSYLLTRIEGKEGSPEKPLSDMGLTAYRAYWDLTVSKHLLKLGMSAVSVKELMRFTGMTADDVVHTLERLYALVRDPMTGNYAIRYNKELYEKLVGDDFKRGNVKLQEEELQWTPYVMGRSDVAHLESAPMQTVAPREGQDDEIMEDLEPPPESAIESEKPKINGIDGDDSHAETNVSPMDVDQPMEEPQSAADSQLVNGLTNGIHHEMPPPSPPLPISSPPRPPDSTLHINGNILHTNGDYRPPSSSPVPGPPSTANLDAALHNQPLLNGIYTTASPARQTHTSTDNTSPPTIDNHPPISIDTSPLEGTVASSTDLSGYALIHHESAIPSSRYQIVPPIPSSVLSAFNRSRRDRRRGVRGSALITPTALGGLGIGGLNTPVRSSPRHSGGVAGLLTNGANGAGDGTGSVTGSLRRGRSGGLMAMEEKGKGVNGRKKVDVEGESDESEEESGESNEESGGDEGSGSESGSEAESGSGSESDEGSDEEEQSEVVDTGVEVEEESSEAESGEDDDEGDVEPEKPKATTAKQTSVSASASASGSQEEDSEDEGDEEESDSDEVEAEPKAEPRVTTEDSESGEDEEQSEEEEASAKQESSSAEEESSEEENAGDNADTKDSSGVDEDSGDDDEDEGAKSNVVDADANADPVLNANADVGAGADAEVDADVDGAADDDDDADAEGDSDPMDVDIGTVNLNLEPLIPSTDSVSASASASTPVPVLAPAKSPTPMVLIPVERDAGKH